MAPFLFSFTVLLLTYRWPELEYLKFLISALMLGTSLAFFAGVDAKVHCHSQQVYEINTLFDDDGVIYTQLQ